MLAMACERACAVKTPYREADVVAQEASLAQVQQSLSPLEKQLAFADSELRNEPAYSCFWDASTKAAAVAALRRGFGRGSC